MAGEFGGKKLAPKIEKWREKIWRQKEKNGGEKIWRQKKRKMAAKNVAFPSSASLYMQTTLRQIRKRSRAYTINIICCSC